MFDPALQLIRQKAGDGIAGLGLTESRRFDSPSETRRYAQRRIPSLFEPTARGAFEINNAS
jgi:hypothetical protein